MKPRPYGFEKEQSRADSLAFAAFNDTFYDEFNADRYFVLLKAYDFQVARKEKRLKLLWESRFSIRRQGADFATELPAMSKFAGLTFGRETGGIFDPTSRETSVKLGGSLSVFIVSIRGSTGSCWLGVITKLRLRSRRS